MPAQKRRKFEGNSPKFKVPKTDGPITSANRFQLLSDDEEEIVSIKEKIPPIIVDSIHSFSDVIGLIGEEYNFKRMSIRTKITFNSLSSYNNALGVLKKREYQFYTLEIEGTKTFKLVLFGLPRFDVKIITGDFISSHNIKTVNVRELTSKRSNKGDEIYLVEFDRQQVYKREIMKVKYFSNVSVYFRRPLKGNKSPTQCSRRVSSSACSGNHELSKCTLNNSSNVGTIICKCYNCMKKNLRNVNLRADNPKYPIR